ncbi:MAG: hypothetical protein LBQ01_06930 [Prevotellaceae bacterium]|nr:hypothetical protein [Prevotellaceae bacterium]
MNIINFSFGTKRVFAMTLFAISLQQAFSRPVVIARNEAIQRSCISGLLRRCFIAIFFDKRHHTFSVAARNGYSQCCRPMYNINEY